MTVVEGMAPTTDVLLWHGVPVLTDSGFVGLGVWMTKTVGIPLDMYPKDEVEGKVLGVQKCQKRVQKN
uniref:Uncharacterized protein n=1 Tax=Lepeophtheirus salmonis TaxID=72036 RepID=A0A0K2U0V0_LEPSM